MFIFPLWFFHHQARCEFSMDLALELQSHAPPIDRDGLRRMLGVSLGVAADDIILADAEQRHTSRSLDVKVTSTDSSMTSEHLRTMLTQSDFVARLPFRDRIDCRDVTIHTRDLDADAFEHLHGCGVLAAVNETVAEAIARPYADTDRLLIDSCFRRTASFELQLAEARTAAAALMKTLGPDGDDEHERLQRLSARATEEREKREAVEDLTRKCDAATEAHLRRNQALSQQTDAVASRRCLQQLQDRNKALRAQATEATERFDSIRWAADEEAREVQQDLDAALRTASAAAAEYSRISGVVWSPVQLQSLCDRAA
jgi:hypothetical protein